MKEPISLLLWLMVAWAVVEILFYTPIVNAYVPNPLMRGLSLYLAAITTGVFCGCLFSLQPLTRGGSEREAGASWAWSWLNTAGSTSIMADAPATSFGAAAAVESNGRITEAAGVTGASVSTAAPGVPAALAPARPVTLAELTASATPIDALVVYAGQNKLQKVRDLIRERGWSSSSSSTAQEMSGRLCFFTDALTTAASHGHLNMVRLLVFHMGAAGLRSELERTQSLANPVVCSMLSHAEEAVAIYLLKVADVPSPATLTVIDSPRTSLLYKAVYQGCEELVAHLVAVDKEGCLSELLADVNKGLLLYAAFTVGSLSSLKLLASLFKGGARQLFDDYAKAVKFCNPLRVSASADRVDIVRWWIEDVGIEAKTLLQNGPTGSPLKVALESAAVNVVRYVLQKLDVSVDSAMEGVEGGRTMLHVVVSWAASDAAMKEWANGAARATKGKKKGKGAKTQTVEDSERGKLLACARCLVEEAGASIDVTDSDGKTALDYAREGGAKCAALVELLTAEAKTKEVRDLFALMEGSEWMHSQS